jgi:hypothetical protein
VGEGERGRGEGGDPDGESTMHGGKVLSCTVCPGRDRKSTSTPFSDRYYLFESREVSLPRPGD